MSSRQLQASLGGVRFRPSGFDVIERAVDVALGSEPPVPLTLGFVNPHVVTSADSHPAIVEHLDTCDHVCVDGTGVWLALGLWRHGIERLTAYRAADLLLTSGVLRGRTALIGIEEHLVADAAAGLAGRHASVDVVGCSHGFSTDAEISAMLDHANPRVVLIGAGSPRSEQIAALVRRSSRDAVVFHVGGGTMNNWAGQRSHAPRPVSKLGVEWLYRLVTEPHTRSRYLHGIPAFIRRVATGPRSISAGEEFVDEHDASEPEYFKGVHS